MQDYKLGLRLGHMSKDLTEANLKAEVKRLNKVHKEELANAA